MNRLGFITPEITMSLGDGSVTISGNGLGLITGGITTMLGQQMPQLVGPMPTLVGPCQRPMLMGLGQPDPTAPSDGASKIIFGTMLLGLGISLGFAMGVSHGVKVAR